MIQETWECERCGKVTFTEPGEQILAEFICLEGLRKNGHGACMGLTRRTYPTSGEVK